ncbi:MAG: trigger factor [Calditrichaceae bacterium]|jgi:trigger factor
MIKTEIKKISNYKKELNITMDKADLEPIREAQVRRVQKEVQFPGFRKGKAPLGMVKKNYADAVEAYTLEAALDESLQKSVIENEIQVVGTPEAKKVDFNDNGDLVSVIEVETTPDVDIKKYKGFPLTKDEYEISDQLVDDTIQRALKEKAELHTVDGAIEKDHLVVLDMQEVDEDGKPIKDKNYKDISLTIGQGKFDPELEEQIIGLKNGEEKQIEKVYPDDFPQKEYAGKKEAYLIKIKSVQREELPELNDEFAKELNEEFKTVEDLKKATREQLENNYKMESENRLNQDLMQKLLEENPFEIPQAMVDNYLNHIVSDVKRRDPNAKEDVIRQHYQSEAEFTIKVHYLKEKIAKVEKIEVGESDIKTFLDELKDEKIREFYEKTPQMLDRVKEDILQKKINDFLLKNTKIKTNKVKL